MIIMRSALHSRSAEEERISQLSTITLISTLITASCYMLALHLDSP